MKEVVYLAAPYSHPDRTVMKKRMQTLDHVMAECIRKGLVVLSPLHNTVPVEHLVDFDQYDWLEYDVPLMSKCDRLLIVCFPGWRESKGVRFEEEFFLAHRKPVEYLDARLVEDWETFDGCVR